MNEVLEKLVESFMRTGYTKEQAETIAKALFPEMSK
jgi:hypothetical protein